MSERLSSKRLRRRLAEAFATVLSRTTDDPGRLEVVADALEIAGCPSIANVLRTGIGGSHS